MSFVSDNIWEGERILQDIDFNHKQSGVRHNKRKTKTCLEQTKANQGPDPNLRPELENERKGKKSFFTISEISLKLELYVLWECDLS